MKNLKEQIILLLLFISLGQISFAQTNFTSTQSGDWDKGATWGNGGNVQGTDWPATTDNAVIVFGTTVLLKGNEIINDLTIDGGGVLNDNNNKITIKGNFLLNGNKTGGRNTVFTGGAGTTIGGTGVHSNRNLVIRGSTTILSGSNLTLTKKLDLKAGVTVTNNGTIEINSALQGADATSVWINASNSSLKVAKNLLTNGTLTANATGNTVIYDRNNPDNIKVPSGTPATYYNLTVEGLGIKTLLGDITILGSLTNSSTLETDAVNNYNINISGDFINYGAFNENLGTVTFEGSNPQTITSTSGEVFYNLTINKSSETLTLSNSVTVSNILSLSAGVVNTGSEKLTLGTGTANTGTLTPGSGQINGEFERWIANTQTGVDIEFPLGTETNSRSARINFSGIATGGSVIFQFVESDPGSAGLSLVDGATTIYNTFVDGYWVMQTANGFVLGANTFNLDLDGTGFLGFPIDSETRLLTRATAGSDWVAEGTHIGAVDPTASRTGLSTMGAQYAFGDDTNCTGPITSAITGSTDVCSNDTNEAYSVTDNSNTYTWTIIGGTQVSGGTTASITVDWGAVGQVGNVSVVEFNGCTSGQEIALSVDINSIAPSSITGKKSVPENATNEAYSVTGRLGYTYVWTITGGTQVSGGTTSDITVDWGASGTGNISVVAQKASCAAASPYDIDVFKYIVVNSARSGDWENSTSWATGTVPLNSDNVRILNGHIITIAGNKTTNHFAVDLGGTIDAKINNRKMKVEGDFTLNGSYLGGNRPLELKGANTDIDGTGTISITNDNIDVIIGNKIILSTANIIITAGSVNLNDANITITNHGSITIVEDLLGMVDGSSTWTNSDNSTLKVGQTVFSTGGTLNASASGNTVEYNGSIAQDIFTTSGNIYHHLIVSGLNSKTLLNNTIINGDISIVSGTLDAGANYNINIAGNWLTTGGSYLASATGTVTFNGGNQSITTAGSAFNNLLLTGTGTKSFQDNLDVNGNLIIEATLLPVNSGFLASVGGNWTNNGTFTRNSETITFDGSANQNIDGTSTSNFTNIIVNKSSGSLNVESTANLFQTLDIQSATILDADGTGSGVFTLKSNATEDSRIGALAAGASITGNLVFEKYFGGTGSKYWRHISSSVVSATIADMQNEIPISGTFTGNDNGTGVIPANAFPSLYYYDNATGLASETLDDRWVVYPTSTNTELFTTSGTEARAYAIWVRETGAITFDLTGSVNQGTIDFTPTGNNEGWNLIGNPYPSDIDWDNAGWTKTDLQGNTIHIWNGTQYLIWNGSIGSLGSGRIAKGQGFWVQAFSTSVGLTATEAVKTATAAATYRIFDEDRPQNIELSVSASGSNDRAYIQFNDSSPFTFDISDAAKLANPIFNLSTLSADSVELSINLLSGKKCAFDVPVHLTNTWNDSYSFAWTLSKELLDVYQITIEDNYTAEVYDINSGAIGFNFDIDDNPGSKSANRFVLHFETSTINNVLISSRQNCDDINNASITVSASQFGVEYSLWKDGERITSLNGTGEMLQFELDSTDLTPGINSFLVKATRLTCSEQQLEFEAELNILAQPVVSYDADQNLLVNSTGQVGHWYNEEILITDTPSNSITPSLLLGGAYSIIVSSENCQLQSPPFLITAMEETISSNTIDVYPNPATDYIEFRLEELIGQEVRISITDINGRVHFLKEIASISEKIDLQNIPQGIYILLLESKTRLYKSRFVKL